MSKQRKSYPLRIDPKLFEEIRRLADSELRSVNAQIEVMLRDAVKRRIQSKSSESSSESSSEED